MDGKDGGGRNHPHIPVRPLPMNEFTANRLSSVVAGTGIHGSLPAVPTSDASITRLSPGVFRPIPTRSRGQQDADDSMSVDSAFEDGTGSSDNSLCSRTTPNNHKSLRKWRQHSCPNASPYNKPPQTNPSASAAAAAVASAASSPLLLPSPAAASQLILKQPPPAHSSSYIKREPISILTSPALASPYGNGPGGGGVGNPFAFPASSGPLSAPSVLSSNGMDPGGGHRGGGGGGPVSPFGSVIPVGIAIGKQREEEEEIERQRSLGIQQTGGFFPPHLPPTGGYNWANPHFFLCAAAAAAAHQSPFNYAAAAAAAAAAATPPSPLPPPGMFHWNTTPPAAPTDSAPYFRPFFDHPPQTLLQPATSSASSTGSSSSAFSPKKISSPNASSTPSTAIIVDVVEKKPTKKEPEVITSPELDVTAMEDEDEEELASSAGGKDRADVTTKEEATSPKAQLPPPTIKIEEEEESTTTAPQRKQLTGLEILTEGIERKRLEERDNVLANGGTKDHRSGLGLLCAAVNTLETDLAETRKIKSAPVSPRESPSTPKRSEEGATTNRSMSLDSPRGLKRSGDVNRNYTSPEAERGVKAFIARKSKVASAEADDVGKNDNDGGMNDWERNVRKNLAEIQRQYKKKYKELYKLQSQQQKKTEAAASVNGAAATTTNGHHSSSTVNNAKSSSTANSIKECWNAKRKLNLSEREKLKKTNPLIFSQKNKSPDSAIRWEVKPKGGALNSSTATAAASATTTQSKIRSFMSTKPSPFENLLRLTSREDPAKVAKTSVEETPQTKEQQDDVEVVEADQVKSRSPSPPVLEPQVPIIEKAPRAESKREEKEQEKANNSHHHHKAKKAKKKKKKKSHKSEASKSDKNSITGSKADEERETNAVAEEMSCQISESDLKEGIRVLARIDNHFYPGSIQEISPPDIYGILVDRERGNKPHILSREEILQDAILEVSPPSLSSLSPGTRVCAFWSEKYHYLFPGTVGDSNFVDERFRNDHVLIELDDGDSREIHFSKIRVLPSDYPIVETDPDPVSGGRRKRKASVDSTSSSNSFGIRNRRGIEGYARISLNVRPPPQAVPPASKSAKEKIEPAKKQTALPGAAPDQQQGNNKKGISAFLPDKNLWQWSSNYRKKSRNKFLHKSIQRKKEVLGLGDCAVFLSTGRPDRPYIGRLDSMWETTSGTRRVRVKWFYHACEAEGVAKSGRRPQDLKYPGALFESTHYDENDLQTISHGCRVLSLTDFRREMGGNQRKMGKIYEHNDTYYLAGSYDPVEGVINFEPGVFENDE